MTESERERAFDRFWRAADSYHEGTGLGLPIAPADSGRRRRRRPAGRTRRRPGRRGAAVPRGGTAHRHAPPRTVGPTGGMGLGVLTVASVRRRPQRSLRSTSRVISLGAKTRNGGPQKPVPRLV
ncbi:hypothetical protein ACFY2D_14765 [Streptomyces nigra]|uniref:hypothetical protein n=1 Tax=Streptomyces nigra TaxID=1827580 RepID=UPI0036C484FF